MCPIRTLAPEEQIANVRSALAGLRAARRHRGRADAVRSAEAQLADLEARHARGELPAVVVSDDSPF